MRVGRRMTGGCIACERYAVGNHKSGCHQTGVEPRPPDNCRASSIAVTTRPVQLLPYAESCGQITTMVAICNTTIREHLIDFIDANLTRNTAHGVFDVRGN